MTWGWTSRSAGGGVSVLALAETLLAGALTLFIAVRFQTLTHVVLSAAIAPLLMLRSEASVRGAADRFRTRLEGIGQKYYDWPILTFFPWLLAQGFGARVYFTLRHLRAGLGNFARNYAVALGKMDVAQRVCLVPETEPVVALIDRHTDRGRLGVSTALDTLAIAFGLAASAVFFSAFLDAVSESVWVKYLVLLIGIVVLTGLLLEFLGALMAYVVFAIALWVRWSVKSTALIWLPLVCLALRAPKGPEGTAAALREERASALAALVRGIAWFSLAFFLWRALIFPSTLHWWAAQDWAAPLLVFILPLGTDARSLHLWHVASGLGAVVTLAGYYLLWERYGRRADVSAPVPSPVATAYRGLYWLRAAISVYSILCGFYFAAQGARLITLPRIDWCPLPWLQSCAVRGF